MTKLARAQLDRALTAKKPVTLTFDGALAAKQFAKLLQNTRTNHRMRSRRMNKVGTVLWDTSPWDDLVIRLARNTVMIVPDTEVGHGITDVEEG